METQMNRARVLIANRPRLIREFVTNWLLRRFLQESHGGFPAAYHNCGTKPTEKNLGPQRSRDNYKESVSLSVTLLLQLFAYISN